jgi:hypothetical protein
MKKQNNDWAGTDQPRFIKRRHFCMPVFGITAEYMCLSTLFMLDSLDDNIPL